MDTNMVLNTGFNELVFENRNKQYGAYQIRKSYRRNIWLSVLVAVTFFSSAMFLYMENIPDAVAAVIPKSDSTKTVLIDLPHDPPKPKIKEFTQPPVAPPAKGLDKPDPNNVLVTKDSVAVKNLIDTITSSKGIVGGTGPVGPNPNPNPCTNCDSSKIHRDPPLVSEIWTPKAPLDPGIDSFFKNNIQYPAMAKDAGIQGTVWLSFIVNSKGEIRDIKIVKSAHPWLDKEVMRVANAMPKWIPNKDPDESVEFVYRKPVRFTLQ